MIDSIDYDAWILLDHELSFLPLKSGFIFPFGALASILENFESSSSCDRTAAKRVERRNGVGKED